MSECVVEIEFVIGTKKIKVIRGIRPNVFEIYINKKLYNQDANQRDYQKYLEQQILKLNYRSFTQVVILGSSTFVPFMQLKARHRRDVVEDILDIQIFSLMNMLLKQRLKGISENQRDVNYNHDLTDEKITLQEKYFEDVKTNKDKLIQEKTVLISGNEEEVFKKKADIDFHTKNNEELLLAIKDSTKVNKDFAKLKDIKSTLTEKKNNRGRMVKFFKDNNDCPACEQPLRNASKMVKSKQKEVDKFTNALVELEQALKVSILRQGEIGKIADRIRENEVYIATENSSITQLEKFNATLLAEINQLETGDVGETDLSELVKLKKHISVLKRKTTKLREDQTYAEAARSLLQDTGIKTKIIKQYLPIMNKLINTYLTSMEFYVNFTLNENFEETIKSRYRDEFTYDSFSEGEKMRIDLALLFTWRAIAKMKNSANTNLLMLDEIFDSSLDGAGTDEFLKILNTLGDENVFVISHKQDMLVDKFKSTIKFEKIKNFSHVTE